MGRFTGALTVAVAALCLGGSALPPGAATAHGGKADERALPPGGVLEIPLQLAAGTYVELLVEQTRGDVAAALTDPLGETIATSDLPGKPWLVETLAAVTSLDGSYLLRFQAAESVPDAVRFRVSTVAQRPSTPADRVLLAALEEWHRALRLKEEQTEESLRRGIELMASAAAMLEGSHFHLHEGRIRREMAKCLSTLGSGEEAEKEVRLAIELLERSGNPIELAYGLNGYGDLLTNRRDLDLARPLYERALDLARREGDLEAQGLTWNNLGVLFFHQGELDRAVEAFETALGLQLATGAEGEQADTLANLAATYRTLGRYADSLRVSEQALALAHRLDDRSSEMNILNTRGIQLKAVGDLRGAIDAYQTALALAQRLGARRKEAVIAGNLGSLYWMLRQRGRSRGYLEQALEAASDAGSATEEAWGLLRLGELAREAGEPEARDYFRRARERSGAADDRFAAAYSLLGVGRSDLDSRAAGAALPALEEALAIQLDISDRPGQLATLRELGRAKAMLGDAPAARRYFDRAVELARVVGDPFQEASTQARYAQFLAGEGNLEEAREHVSAALRTFESLRLGVAQPDFRAGFLSQSQGDFALLVDILDQLDRRYPGEGYAEQAFEVGERGRARSLVELLAEARAGLERELPAELRGRRLDLAGRLSTAQRDLTEALQDVDVDAARVDALRREITAANREREEVESRIRASDPRWLSLEAPAPLGVGDVRRMLAPGQALISFVLGEERSFVFAVTADRFALERLPAEAELERRVGELLQVLETPSRRGMGRLLGAARQLYDRLLEPVAVVLAESSHLVVVPDGVLCYLPFEVLVGGGAPGAANAYVLERWAVSYAPSASTLSLLERDGPAAWSAAGGPRLVAFADPTLPGTPAPVETAEPLLRGLTERDSWVWRRLAGARAEVESIAGLFAPGESSIFVGPEASEARFKTEPAVRGARYVHVASHALIDDQEPALSSLLLSPSADGTDDGLLQTHEIFDLELAAELVVLSGCETALGQAVRGEGLLGLTRAFLSAGAVAVSVSLWPVEDESTALLMARFYRELNAGRGPVEALRRAKLGQLRDGARSHPYYWAPFVLVGNPS